MNTDLLSVKELAAKLNRSRSYIHAMKSDGFKMPGGRSTLEAAVKWLDSNPTPRRRARDKTEQKGTL